MVRRRRVSFTATRMLPRQVRVSFETKRGKKVSFAATKKTPKKVRVKFYAKRKKKCE
jgi:hypothetical protein